MLSGHKSLISNTQGTLLIFDKRNAEKVVKNWGLVAISKSPFINNPAIKDVKKK